MDRGTDGGTIYEQSSGRVRKKVVRPEIDAAHRSIIRDYRENSFRVTAHLGNGLGPRTSKLSGQFRRNLLISVKNCRYDIDNFLESSCDVRSHATNADKTDARGFHTVEYGSVSK